MRPEVAAGVFPGFAEIAGGGDNYAGDDSRTGLIDLDPDTRVGRDVYGGGSDGEDYEDGSMGLDTDYGVVFGIVGGIGGDIDMHDGHLPAEMKKKTRGGRQAKMGGYQRAAFRAARNLLPTPTCEPKKI
jgi:hypothetical protein